MVWSISPMMAQTDPGTSSLTHQWTFQDGTANDRVGSVNGTLVNGATITNKQLSTKNGGYLSFPASELAINTYNAITTEIWFKPVAGANPGYTMLTYFGNTTNTYGTNYLYMTSARGDDLSRAGISCGNLTAPWEAEAFVNGPEYDDGQLHQMVSVLTSTTLTFYIDGIKKGTTTLAANNTIAAIGTQFAYLAKGGYPGDSTWRGDITKFSIYNKALTDAEVQYLFNATYTIDYNSTITHEWNFDQGHINESEGIAYDVVGNAHGKIKGSAYFGENSLMTRGGYLDLPGDSIKISTYKELSMDVWFKSILNGNSFFTMICYFGDVTPYRGSIPERIGTSVGSDGCFIATSRGDHISRAAISCRTLPEPWAGESMVDYNEYKDSTLHHMVSSISNTSISFYIDGRLIGSSLLADSNRISKMSNKYAFLAQSGYVGFDSTWMGSIYRFRLFNKALTQSEVSYFYNDGAETNPMLVSSVNELLFDEFNTKKQFDISGYKLKDSIHLSAPVGFSVTPKVIAPNNLNVPVVVDYIGSTSTNGFVTLISGTTIKKLWVEAKKNSDCMVPLYQNLTNLISDPYFSKLTSFGGWTSPTGSTSINEDLRYVYCGNNSGKVTGTTNNSGSIDFVLTGKLKSNTFYRVKAMVYAVDGPFQVGVYGWANGMPDSAIVVRTLGSWRTVDFTFKTGSTLKSSQGLFFNNSLTDGGKTGFIDNWEIYELPSTALKSFQDILHVNVSIDKNQINTHFELLHGETVEFSIYNLQGVLLKKEMVYCQAGLNSKSIQTALPGGLYILTVKTKDSTYTQKLIL